MSRPLTRLALAACLAAPITATPASAEPAKVAAPTIDYSRVIQRVVAMPGDGDLRQRTAKLGLGVMNVMWEDTGRAAGSSLGPNISDLTLQVREKTAYGLRTHLLPVIRHPNFSDKTADVPADSLWVRVGNQRAHADGEDVDSSTLKSVPLTHLLANMGAFLSDPQSLKGSGDFLAERDTHVLVSAQHVFVPLPMQGKAEFNPVLFNYQSAPDSPAVLTLLVTRQGTSATIIENRAGDQTLQGWGQQLYFNKGGERTVFTAERRSAVAARIEQTRAVGGTLDAQDRGALEEGADMMLIVQVPLVHEGRGFLNGMEGGMLELDSAADFDGAPMPAKSMRRTRGESNVEQAVLGHGEVLGPFREMGGLELKRDARFPIRVTVQFYKATSNGVISDADLKAAHDDIERVYADGDYVGSLVVPEGERTRPTDWIKDDPQGGAWWPMPDWSWFGWR